MSEPTSGGLMRNKAHYTMPVLVGGLVAGVLSAIPILNYFNVIFCLWMLVGASLSVMLVQRKANTVEIGEAAVIGALSGVVCALVVWILGCCAAGVGSVVVLPDASNRETEEFLTFVALALVGGCVGGLIVYPLFGALGGLLGGLIFKPDPRLAPAGVPGAPMAPAVSPEEAAARRGKWLKIGGASCAGCSVIMLALCGAGGYLYYLEEEVHPADTAGSDEIVSAPYTPGARVQIDLPDDEDEYTRYAFWLVGSGPLPGDIRVRGEMSCDAPYRATDDPYLSPFFVFSRPDEEHPEWLFLREEFTLYRHEHCVMDLTVEPPVAGARIVVTKFERPSDWL